MTTSDLLIDDGFKNVVEYERAEKMTVYLGINDIGGLVKIPLYLTPHILVAGATGSGKSVALNTIICSLLLFNNANDLKWFMIDTKKVELSFYQDLFYTKKLTYGLIDPIAKNPDDAISILNKAISIMDSRYNLLEQNKLKNIHDYTKEKICDIVIVVDELADLLYYDKKKIEPLLTKIATLGRAAGIHLIMATQRPTVDIVCGQLKANIDTRLCLRVASIRDSINVIDKKGGETLKGSGDALLKLPTQPDEIHLQVAYIKDENIKRIVNYKTT